MGSDINSGAKIAVSICVICFILSIGLLIMMLAMHFWRETEANFERPLANMENADAGFLASYSKPTPVAATWKVIQNIGTGNIGRFVLKETAPSGAITVKYDTDTVYPKPATSAIGSLAIAQLNEHLDEKCYLSWDMDTYGGQYTVEVTLAP